MLYVSPASAFARQRLAPLAKQLLPTARVLEVGGGNGAMREQLGRWLPQGVSVISTDLDPSDASDAACDARCLPFRDNSFELVVALEILEHVPETDAVMSEIARVGKPGAAVVVSTPFMYGRHDAHDYYRFTPAALTLILQRNRIRPAAITPRGGTFMSIALMLLELVHQTVAPQDESWRASGRRRRRLALAKVLTSPLLLASWLGAAIDAFVDRRKWNTSGYVAVGYVANDEDARSTTASS